MLRRRFLAIAFMTGTGGMLAGCGGSIPIGGGSTRRKVLELHQRITGGARTFSSAGMSGAGLSADAAGGGAAPPMLGAFLNFGAPPSGGGISRRRKRPATRQEDPAPPTFYYDEFLELWVSVLDSPGHSRYEFFLDEGKSQPAGFMETVWPEDWTVYPQVWTSSYRFEAGSLRGAEGNWDSRYDADGSGESSGLNRWTDGSTQRSESRWFANGDSTWNYRSEGPGTWWNESSGTFRHDGSGGMRHRDSDGYGATYLYFADGSGRATFEGPGPDFPVVIGWDGRGNAWIQYADGRKERIDGWWGCWWGIVAVSDGPGGSSGSSDGSTGP